MLLLWGGDHSLEPAMAILLPRSPFPSSRPLKVAPAGWHLQFYPEQGCHAEPQHATVPFSAFSKLWMGDQPFDFRVVAR